jgi:hypothetical protein
MCVLPGHRTTVWVHYPGELEANQRTDLDSDWCEYNDGFRYPAAACTLPGVWTPIWSRFQPHVNRVEGTIASWWQHFTERRATGVLSKELKFLFPKETCVRLGGDNGGGAGLLTENLCVLPGKWTAVWSLHPSIKGTEKTNEVFPPGRCENAGGTVGCACARALFALVRFLWQCSCSFCPL